MILSTLLLALAPTDPTTLAYQQRERAAETLEVALDADDGAMVSTEARLTRLRAAGRVARRALGEQRIGDLLDRDLEDAAWRAKTDLAAAVAELDEDLRAHMSDLRFRPLLEAAQPPGFPQPTPIHELRLTEYPSYRLAYADMSGPRDGGAFWKLFRHIQSNGVEMTAPVETTFDDSRTEETRMAFLYEGPTQGELGFDGSVEVIDVPAATVVSIGCRGRDSRSRILEMRALLEAWVESNADYEVGGEMRTMGFNSPAVWGDRRYFEVQLPVRRVPETVEPSAPVLREA